MIAFDRDGVLVGVLGDWEACHPKHYNNSIEMPLIKEVIQKINEPCIVISNQQGIKWGYSRLETVVKQFQWLMQQVPQVQACLFCPDEGYHTCFLHREGSSFRSVCSQPIYRKPNSGMIDVAIEQRFPINTYIGDLSGNLDYADGRDSDRQFAQNAGLKYLDVNEFIGG